MVEIQAKDAMEAAFGAGESTGPESRRRRKVFPGDHGDVLIEGPKVQQWLNERQTLVQRASVNEVARQIQLDACSVDALRVGWKMTYTSESLIVVDCYVN